MVYRDMRHIFNYGIMYTRFFLIKTTQPAMLAATKLRRGMIPKDKEKGDVNVERGVMRENYVSPPPLVIFLLLVEATIGWKEDRCHATLALLSTT